MSNITAVILGAAMFLWQFAFNGNGSGFLEADFLMSGKATRFLRDRTVFRF